MPKKHTNSTVYTPDGGAAAGAPRQNDRNLSLNISSSLSSDKPKLITVENEDTIERLNYTYNLLNQLKLILKLPHIEEREFYSQEFFKASLLIQLVTNNLIVIKNHNTEIANDVRSKLFDDAGEGNLKLIYHLDRDTIAHVLNLDYFHKSHTENLESGESIHNYWYREIFAENCLFDSIEMILAENTNLNISRSSLIDSLSVSSIDFDSYYGMSETSRLPKIVGALISKYHTKYDYQRTFNDKGSAALQLLKYNIDLALRAKSDVSNDAIFVYIQAIEAVGNCAKILKLISYNLPEFIKSKLTILSEVRNKLAHAYSLEWMIKIKNKADDFHDILESLLKNLSDIEEANIPEKSLEIEILDDLYEEDQFAIQTAERKSLKNRSERKLDRYEEEKIISDAQKMAQEELSLVETIKNEIRQQSEISSKLYDLSIRSAKEDLFEEVADLVRDENFDINQLCRILHKPVALNAKSKKGRLPLEIRRMELEELLNGNLKTDGAEVETEILPINLIIYLYQKTNDTRYAELLSEILLKQDIDSCYIKLLNVHTNPLLMFMFGEKKADEDILRYIRKYYEGFSKEIINSFKTSIMNCESKIFKLLEKLMPNIDVPLEAIGVIAEDNDIYEYFYRMKLPKKIHDYIVVEMVANAIVYQKKKILEELHSSGVDINNSIIFNNNTSPIHEACRAKDLEIVKFLVSIGADINSISGEGLTPLAYAITRYRKDIFEYLVSLEGMDYSIKQYLCVCTSLANEQELEYYATQLLKIPAVNVNKKDERGFAPLIIAAQGNKINFGKIFLSHPDIEINQTLSDGQTALTIAAGEGNAEFIKLLLSCEGIEINHRTNKGYTALMIAAEEGHLQSVKTLLEDDRVEANAELPTMEVALGLAMNNDNIDIFELLLNSTKVNVNIADILLRAIKISKTPYGEKFLDLLLSREDLEINFIEKIGGPAFIFALTENNEYAMKALYKKMEDDSVLVNSIFKYFASCPEEMYKALEIIQRFREKNEESEEAIDEYQADHVTDLSGGLYFTDESS